MKESLQMLPPCAAFLLMTAFYLGYEHIKQISGHSRPLATALKCSATAMAVLTALWGCLQRGLPAHWVLLAGLIVCTAADGVLNVRFIPGGVLFGLGHILYMVSFCLMHLPNWRSVLLFLCMMGLATAGYFRFQKRIGRRAPFFYAYAAVLSLMISMAAAQTPLYFAGALAFAFSDALLGYLLADRQHIYLDYVSLGAYYLGQFLLALGVCFG